MKSMRYTDEFKVEVVKQITEQGRGILEVAQRLGVSGKKPVRLAQAGPQQAKQPSRNGQFPGRCCLADRYRSTSQRHGYKQSWIYLITSKGSTIGRGGTATSAPATPRGSKLGGCLFPTEG